MKIVANSSFVKYDGSYRSYLKILSYFKSFVKDCAMVWAVDGTLEFVSDFDLEPGDFFAMTPDNSPLINEFYTHEVRKFDGEVDTYYDILSNLSYSPSYTAFVPGDSMALSSLNLAEVGDYVDVEGNIYTKKYYTPLEDLMGEIN